MKNPLFQSVRVKKPGYNAFDLGHEVKLSCNMGDLVPILVQEIVPGDRFKVTTEMLMRLAPMISPVMHRINVFTHFFFVPNRLVYDKWEDFITGGRDGLQAPGFPSFIIQESNKAQFAPGTLADYMGIPPANDVTVGGPIGLNSLPFRAYQMIYNEYYRDQNLTAPLAIPTGEGTTPQEQELLMTLRKRCWEKDYFTSALPWAQRGAEVKMPIGDTAPVVYNDAAWVPLWHAQNKAQFGDVAKGIKRSGLATDLAQGVFDDGDRVVAYDPNGTLDADLSNATTSSINDLRRAYKLQEWLERNARGGYRYIEQILSHFGVKSSDARLQRPEFLGGGKSPVVISEVLSTTEDASVPQGNMAGHGIAVGSNHGFNKRFEEHGYIIGIMSVLPRTAYQQGIPRMYMHQDKFDFYWPEFANIGEQEVLKHELYANYANPPAGSALFGYQSRYAEYKFNQSRVHGDFRDNLSFWHMGRIFDDAPALNEDFVQSNPTQRIFAVEDPLVHKLYVQLYHDIKAIRPMPMYGTPSF